MFSSFNHSFKNGGKMIPILSYLIIIALQVIGSWEFINWVIKKRKDDEPILIFVSIIFLATILLLFNYLLYWGGFYRLSWGW